MAKPEWMPQRLYQWTKPRSLMLHALYAVVATGCLVAFWWQVHRAMQGNALSYLYSVEWPAIGIVVGIGWWQLVHDTPEDIARRTEYHRRMRQASAEVVARTLPRSALALTVDSAEVDGRVLGPAAARAVTAGGATGPDGPGSALVATGFLPAGSHGGLPETRLLDPDAADGPDGPVDDMDDYNRYLARLAVKGRAKTWRHPHGL